MPLIEAIEGRNQEDNMGRTPALVRARSALMLDLLDLEKVRAVGPRRFLFVFALSLAMLFFGLFVAAGVITDGQYKADRGLLITSLVYGFVMTAIFGREIWRLSSEQN
ncbi:hypothetical protein [Roseateles sp.]|uniref:hypothetical protein n=1 Tax=Roseateles sp. TaxID=1971397 RepID=UPI0031D4D9CC